jgi:hypothetical protein
MTKDTNKLSMDVVKAINLIVINETPLSLLTKIASTPNMGINSKDDNNIKKTKKKRPLRSME